MRRARVVIGSGFGDEGKGLAADLHAASSKIETLVVRHNGGAQAGHTVVMPDGRRHVFSHVGSGSFAGASTYLSRFFVCHPILFRDELRRLGELGVRPRVCVDPAAPVTTPFDMMLNQHVEASRGGARHGSCGLGFGETLERDQYPAFRVRAADLADPRRLARALDAIREDYVPRRLRELGLPPLPAYAEAADIARRFVEDARHFVERTQIRDAEVLQEDIELIFEGAQGLLLDMERGEFPHVTRSHTGIRNAATLANAAGIGELDITYVSRWYATRHGAGPLDHELDGPPFRGPGDSTNRDNPWQGALRFGLLDVDRLARAVRADLGDGGDLALRHHWLVTWADRAPATIACAWRDTRAELEVGDLGSLLAEASGGEGHRLAWGPTRADVGSLYLERSASVQPSRNAGSRDRHSQVPR